jgi:ketosteroid isomerase-like protein
MCQAWPMSPNLDLVRSIYADWERGVMADEKFDPEISMIESSALPGGGASAQGIDAVRNYIRSFEKYWDEIRFEPLEYLDAGERVVVVARLVGRGKKSGVEVSRDWAYVWTLRDGKALRMQGYDSRDEALEAAGLPR